jgi:hypothetical protein
MRMFELVVDVADGPQDRVIPERLIFGERTVRVVDVLDRWHGTDHVYVKLLGEDGAAYILRLDTGSGVWRLVQFIRQSTEAVDLQVPSSCQPDH